MFYLEGREKIFRNAINNAAPIMAHTIGNGWSPNLIQGNIGRSNCRAIKVPMREPINPSAIDARQPNPLLPASLAPMAPAMDAIKSNNKNDIKFMIPPFF
jgi:hypothetical protein